MEKYVNVKKIHAQIMDAFETALEVIETENAVEIVRCKDCKHMVRLSNVFPMDISCSYFRTDYGIEPEHFCSYGERREENAAD